MDRWTALAQKISALPLTNPQAREFRRQVFGGAADLEPDKQGRVSLPPYLRQYAHIDKQVVIIGLFDHCEIWNPDMWRERQQRSYNDPEGRAEQFESLGI
jgi:MraZ protein